MVLRQLLLLSGVEAALFCLQANADPESGVYPALRICVDDGTQMVQQTAFVDGNDVLTQRRAGLLHSMAGEQRNMGGEPLLVAAGDNNGYHTTAAHVPLVVLDNHHRPNSTVPGQRVSGQVRHENITSPGLKVLRHSPYSPPNHDGNQMPLSKRPSPHPNEP